MPSYLMLVYSRAKPGQEAAYNDWYSNQHVPDVLSVPGFVAAQRFEIEGLADDASGRQYLAIYEIDGITLEEAQTKLAAAVQSGQVTLSETLDLPNVSRVLLRPMTERITPTA